LTTAEYFAQKIEDARKAYAPVAVHGTRLFFVIRSLSELDPMYYFSMAWFRDLFSESLTKPEETAVFERNIKPRGI
jgi:dynein heavy chain